MTYTQMQTPVGRDSISSNSSSCSSSARGGSSKTAVRPCTHLIKTGIECGMTALALALALTPVPLLPVGDTYQRRRSVIGYRNKTSHHVPPPQSPSHHLFFNGALQPVAQELHRQRHIMLPTQRGGLQELRTYVRRITQKIGIINTACGKMFWDRDRRYKKKSSAQDSRHLEPSTVVSRLRQNWSVPLLYSRWGRKTIRRTTAAVETII